MPNELSIQGVTPIGPAGDTTTEQKSDARTFSPAPPQTMAPQPFVNPSLRLDAALGLVVIEFRDDGGAITSSIPSQRQLEAYRAHAQPPPSQEAPTDEPKNATARPGSRAGPPADAPGSSTTEETRGADGPPTRPVTSPRPA